MLEQGWNVTAGRGWGWVRRASERVVARGGVVAVVSCFLVFMDPPLDGINVETRYCLNKLCRATEPGDVGCILLGTKSHIYVQDGPPLRSTVRETKAKDYEYCDKLHCNFA